MLKLFIWLFGSLLLVGCKTVPMQSASTQPIQSADEWMATTAFESVSDSDLSHAAIASFLRRTGFEPAPSEINALMGLTRYQLIEKTLTGLYTRPVIPVPNWTRQDGRYWIRDVLDEQFRQAFENARAAEVTQLRQWWVQQMIETPTPMAERMVLFLDNRFVAAFSGVNDNSHAMWQHHQLLREHAIGDYKSIVQGTVRDPAVLMYLDNDRNTKEAPNENLAREIMELYVLGEGNYTEKDIKQTAKALTGYAFTTFGGTRFEKKSWAMAGGRKTIFGQSGNFDGDDVPRLLLNHPAAAEHLVEGLWYEFVSSAEPQPELIAQWADAARAVDFQLDQILKVMLYSPEFWNPQHQGFGVKSPVEYVVGAVRSTQSNHMSPVRLVSAIQAQGQTLFDPPDVSGYDGGVDWLAPEYLVERQAFAKEFSEGWGEQDKQTTIESDLVLTLGGEAYFGGPTYQVSVIYGEGRRWTGSGHELEFARDTQRLGRYEDDSQIEWSQVPVQLPDYIEDVSGLEVRFMYDAGGSDGDRNLFVAGAEYQGQSYPASLGTQFPGCRGNEENTKRKPGALYCAGVWKLDLASMQSATHASEPAQPVPGDLNTRGFHVRWANAPDDRWRNMDVVFDGLEFEGRQWDVFSFQYQISEQGRYEVSFNGRDCVPDCFSKWPNKAWRDKAGIPHVNVPYSSGDNWAYDQYNGLSKQDKRLVKALMGAAKSLKLTSRTFTQHPDRLEFWSKELQAFIKKGDSRRWRLDPQPAVTVLGDTRQEMMMSMGGMMGADTLNYQPPSGLVSVQQWQESADELGSLSDWALPVMADVTDYRDVLQHAGYYLR